MARVCCVAPGMAESMLRCMRNMVLLSGHEPVAADPDVFTVACFGGYATDFVPQPKKPVIRWWVGSDVLKLQGGYTKSHTAETTYHWAVAPWLRDELAAEHVHSRILPILPLWEPHELPWPSEKVVLAYCPQSAEDLYGWDRVLKVAEMMPTTKFRVYRRGGPNPLPNVECVPGWTPFDTMPEHYAKARAILRLPRHDGMSLTVLEALGFARYVVWNRPWGCVNWVENAVEAVYALRDVLKRGPHGPAVREMQNMRRMTLAVMGRYIEEALA